MSNKQKSTKSKGLPLTGAMGIATLFVVASICYSVFVIATGTEGWIPKIMVAPQAIFATVVLIKKFTN